jgi:hypothetical protein
MALKQAPSWLSSPFALSEPLGYGYGWSYRASEVVMLAHTTGCSLVRACDSVTAQVRPASATAGAT